MNSSKQHLIIIRDSSEMIINGTHAHHGIEPRVLTSLVASSARMKMLNVYPLLPQKLSYGLMLVYISHLSKQLLNYQFVGKMLVFLPAACGMVIHRVKLLLGGTFRSSNRKTNVVDYCTGFIILFCFLL